MACFYNPFGFIFRVSSLFFFLFLGINLIEVVSFQAKWSGVGTEYGTTHFVDYMQIELKGMLDEFEVIVSRWPIYSSPLENVSEIYL